MNISPNITILIPTYNSEKLLSFALDSLLSQRYSDYRVCLVDDGSIDSTLNIARNYACRFQDFQIFEGCNVGIGANWNRAVTHVSTEYYTILHFDDEYHPDYLVKMKNLMDQYPNAAIGHCPAKAIDKDSKTYMSLLEQYKLSSFFPEDHFCLSRSVEFNRLITGNFINCPSVMYRTSICSKIGPFNEDYSHVLDWDYWFRVLESGSQICATKEVLFYYRRHDDNASVHNSRNLRRYFEEVELLSDAITWGASCGWLQSTDAYAFSPVLQGGIMDISEDLVSGRKDLAKDKREALKALIGQKSIKGKFVLSTIKLLVGMGHIGGYAIKTTVFLAITILGSVKS
jgi:glycosyltransferase involved in cell wall biosynthesis